MVAFDAGVLVLLVVVGLALYPLGVVILDYFGESYNNAAVAQGYGDQQIVDGFKILYFGWQCEPLASIIGAALASVIVGQVRRSGG